MNMKKIRIAFTNEKRILAIASPSSIPSLLRGEERILKEWFYESPKGLENFLRENPEKTDDILKTVSYWIMRQVFGFEEDENQYGTVKRELQEFSKKMFTSLRAIAKRIADQIGKFLNPSAKKTKMTY